MVCTPNNHGHYDTQTQNQSGQSIYKLDLIAAQLFCGVCFFYRRVFLSARKTRMKGATFLFANKQTITTKRSHHFIDTFIFVYL